MITSKQIELIQASFPAIARMGEIFALTFHQRAMQLDPDLRVVFRGNVHSSAASFMEALTFAVANLERWQEIHPDLQSMGRRHCRAGMREDQYPILAAALKHTLAWHLSDAASPDTVAAWDALIRTMTGTMIAAARDMQSGGQSTSLFAKSPPGPPPNHRV